MSVRDPLQFNVQQGIHSLKSAIKLAEDENSKLNALDDVARVATFPHATMPVTQSFRPILFDICARWLMDSDRNEDKLCAFALLISVHQELFPILHEFLRRPCFVDGPLGLLSNEEACSQKERMHSLLVAYYRLLRACPYLSRQFHWPLSRIAELLALSGLDTGSIYLLIRCYALQSGMAERERETVENNRLGEPGSADVSILYDSDAEGRLREIDGWLFPLIEEMRVRDYRCGSYEDFDNDSMLIDSDTMTDGDLCSRVANVQGVLLLIHGSRLSRQTDHDLVLTPTIEKVLFNLALLTSLRTSILLSSPHSTGKSLLIRSMASQLHPGRKNQVVVITLADTSLDPRSLLGFYATTQSHDGHFEWRDGTLIHAMKEGKWVILKDIDKASLEVLGMLSPLFESLAPGRPIGLPAHIDVPGKNRVHASEGFMLFATRSVEIDAETASGDPHRQASKHGFSSSTFFSAHNFSEVGFSAPDSSELLTVIESRHPALRGAISSAVIVLWKLLMVVREEFHGACKLSLRELDVFCRRLQSFVTSFPPKSHVPDLPVIISMVDVYPNVSHRENIFLEARDVFFGSHATTRTIASGNKALSVAAANWLELTEERTHWLLHNEAPRHRIERDANGRPLAFHIDNVTLESNHSRDIRSLGLPGSRRFVVHRPAAVLLSRIAKCIQGNEPVLLTGETGTGKTSVVSFLAEQVLGRRLIPLNLSTQTESGDLLGSLKPIDARALAHSLQARFADLFRKTFSLKKNAEYEGAVRKAVSRANWKRAVTMWTDAVKLARQRFASVVNGQSPQDLDVNPSEASRKRRKLSHDSMAEWSAFDKDVEAFYASNVQSSGRFSFSFLEGPLVKALRNGDWLLLDEINLATSETLEAIAPLLSSPDASLTLVEQGSVAQVPRHPEFRLFACMNPATDAGKKDLPPHIRSRFTEIDVPPPDKDRETLLSIVQQYIGHLCVRDQAALADVADFYVGARALSEDRRLADGSNQPVHYSMRTLTRALNFVSETAGLFGLRRSLWESCVMAFTLSLDSNSNNLMMRLLEQRILPLKTTSRALLSQTPTDPTNATDRVRLGSFWLRKGPLPTTDADEYILTPSVQKKINDLARVIMAHDFPVLIEGPTSSGKTSSIEYLARLTGHRFVRINNHEYTDIQEYLGSYTSDPESGLFSYQDGLLVRALRNGDWIVLDELNLAPTEVLEALNRLLDDNRELFIPETQEIIRPHPNFMLFATQNPSGLYGGRKVLSRAFRNRFLEMHFGEIPQVELEEILYQHCQIAPSYAKKIVTVFLELRQRRQAGRVFESRQAFATLRDLFRWGKRSAVGYQELAENGFMLLAERARREDDRAAVKAVIEEVMRITIDETRLYQAPSLPTQLDGHMGLHAPSASDVAWTTGMQRLYCLVSRALAFNEPVLLVGETGCGKTTVCQIYAEMSEKSLICLSCNQNTETADLIGGQRPVRNRSSTHGSALQFAQNALAKLDNSISAPTTLAEAIAAVHSALRREELSSRLKIELQQCRQELLKAGSIFEWRDGPLINAMATGSVFLLDEISLADDAVLERLNSVLEPGRAMFVPERGGLEGESPVRASESFKLVATMNPGGDYGKKELSPALRNRFTEIWVPANFDRQDRRLIVDHAWSPVSLRSLAEPLLNFSEWLIDRVRDSSVIGVRDLLAWVAFAKSLSIFPLSHDEILYESAHAAVLDGLETLPQLVGYSPESLQLLRRDAEDFLEAQLQVKRTINPPSYNVPRGTLPMASTEFEDSSPTVARNLARLLRACQISKPIMLEGSPGVGKTSLVQELANRFGHRLCRINLSDQTDLADLFGSDLPVEGGKPGEFAWRDADFLVALQTGYWVLLDEMNLAPQAVLEGLNAVLDHRGTVFIPELNRSFTRHPNFRVFAAQNPMQEGGARKGLPKSFVNRFTKVFIEPLASEDLLHILRRVHPLASAQHGDVIVELTARLARETSVTRTFGLDGSPWEFNLRDILRWAKLEEVALAQHRDAFIRNVDLAFFERFRTLSDRHSAHAILANVTSSVQIQPTIRPAMVLNPQSVSCDGIDVGRGPYHDSLVTAHLLRTRLTAVHAVASCVRHNWLAIIVGPAGSGKTSILKFLANSFGIRLRRLNMHPATDTTDLLGSYEQVDDQFALRNLASRVLELCYSFQRTSHGATVHSVDFQDLQRAVTDPSDTRSGLRDLVLRVLGYLREVGAVEKSELEALQGEAQRHALDGHSTHFAWSDGPLVQALKSGDWLVLENANMCSASVLDRLNSLCEPYGTLTLSEKGQLSGGTDVIKPHQSFRLFICMDPLNGELSRAMRNRGTEVALVGTLDREDATRVATSQRVGVSRSLHHVTPEEMEIVRRGLRSCPQLEQAFSSDLITSDHLVARFMTGISLASSSIVQSSEDHHSLLLHFLTFMPLHERRLWSRFYDWLKQRQLTTVAATFEKFIEHPTFDEFIRFRDSAAVMSSSQLSKSYLMSSRLPLSLTNQQSSASSLNVFLIRLLELIFVLVCDDIPSMHVLGSRLIKQAGNTNPKPLRASVSTAALLQCLRQLALDLVSVGRKFLHFAHAQQDFTTLIDASIYAVSYLPALRGMLLGGTVDHSVLSVMCAELLSITSLSSPIMQDVRAATIQVANLAKSQSGLGMAHLWRALLANTIDDVMSLDRLDKRLLTGSGFDAIPEGSSKVDEHDLLELDRRFTSDGKKAIVAAFSRHKALTEHPILEAGDLVSTCLVAELSFVSLISPSVTSMKNQDVLGRLKGYLRFAIKNPITGVKRLSLYQQTVWALENGDGAASHVATAAALQNHWTSCFWNESLAWGSDILFAKPSSLLLPLRMFKVLTQWCVTLLGMLRDASLEFSDPSGRSLASLSVYRNSLRTEYDAIMCTLDVVQWSRARLLTVLLVQSVGTLLACYPESSSSCDSDILAAACYNPLRAPRDTASQLIDITKAIRDKDIQQLFLNFLNESLLNVLESDSGASNFGLALGRAWAALGQLILDLYVPENPLDPVASHNFRIAIWQSRNQWLEAQLTVALAAIRFDTGDSTSLHIQDLERRRRHLQAMDPMQVQNSCRQKSDSVVLHAFFREVHQFSEQIIAKSMLERIFSPSSGQNDESQSQVLQQSIGTFIERLTATYADYRDLLEPIVLALNFIRFGSAFLPKSQDLHGIDSRYTGLIETFATVPMTVGLLTGAGFKSTTTLSALEHVLSLGVIVARHSMGAPLADLMVTIEDCLDSLFSLWQQDMDNKARLQAEHTSIYRSTEHKSQDTDKDSIEEAEFRQMFPDFAHAGPSPSRESPIVQSPATDLLSYTQTISAFHMSIFSPLDGADPWRHEFEALRSRVIRNIVSSKFAGLPESLDRSCQPYYISQLQRISRKLEASEITASVNFDFYHQSYPHETRKASALLQTMLARLDELLSTWPEQMVLQDLRSRCLNALSINLSSPVAQVLSVLEQLLLRSDDWELFANRDNSLAEIRTAMTEQIVEWRRMELSCWDSLLELEAKRFLESLDDWWFRLYELTVRGVTSAANQGDTDNQQKSLRSYHSQMLDLLRQFMIMSPIGQYASRLDLLHTFAVHVANIAIAKTGVVSTALHKTERILRNIYNYFKQFSSVIAQQLAERRASIEKEVKAFVKLASWKDVNVLALKQSAQRTHRLLHKSIRKFRDALRQPVDVHLLLLSEIPIIQTTHGKLAEHSSTNLEEHPISSHYANKLQRFKGIISRDVVPNLEKHITVDLGVYSGELVDLVKNLREETRRLDGEADKNLQKQLQVRKRQLFASVLKELKRLGFSTRVKANVVADQSEDLFLFEQVMTISASSACPAVEEGDVHFYRLLNLLPQLRNAALHPHEDIPRHESERAMSLIDSIVYYALQTRNDLINIMEQTATMNGTISRLFAITERRTILATGSKATTIMGCIRTTLGQVVRALQETKEHAIDLRCDDEHQNSALTACLSALETQLASVQSHLHHVTTIDQVSSSTRPHMLFDDEMSIIVKALEVITETEATLRLWSSQVPCLHQVLQVTSDWLLTVSHGVQETLQIAEGDSTEFVSETLINALLVATQDLMVDIKPLGDTISTEHTKDYVRKITSLLHSVQERMHHALISRLLEQYIQSLKRRNLTDVDISPVHFLQSFSKLSAKFVSLRAVWTKSCLELACTATSLLYSIMSKGFCQPSESETQDGDGTGVTDGTGFGEGTGTDNISEQVQDESQIEGLKNDNTNDQQKEEGGEAVEMSGDLEGDLEDIEDMHDGDRDENSDSDEESDLDEHVDQLDPLDPNAVDEKLWDDTSKEPHDQQQQSSNKGKASEDRSELETSAKEDENNDQAEGDGKDPTKGMEDQPSADADSDSTYMDTHPPDAPEIPLDENMKESSILDLPDDINMDDTRSQEDIEALDDADDGEMSPNPDTGTIDTQSEAMEEDASEDGTDGAGPSQDVDDDTSMEHQGIDRALDHSAVGTGASGTSGTGDHSEEAQAREEPSNQDGRNETSVDTVDADSHNTGVTGNTNDESSTALAASSQQQPSKGGQEIVVKPQPQSAHEVQRRVQSIQEAVEQEQTSPTAEHTSGTNQFELASENEYRMEALGPAMGQTPANINDINVIETDEDAVIDQGLDELTRDSTIPETVDKHEHTVPNSRKMELGPNTNTSDRKEPDMNIGNQYGEKQNYQNDLPTVESSTWEWMQGDDRQGAETVWRVYEGLTLNHAYALCEQLRLILEPTKATRLRGDYRTGKRINMKKVIPFIASEYTKDKIWLRRTKPSQREYQVLIAIDDSKSMAESRSVHLAFQTLALVSKALSRLEVGDIAIAKFGEAFELLHGLDGKPFTSEAGANVIKSFNFNQKATNVLDLIKSSIDVLSMARERRGSSSSSSANLWQLEIVISDGICQSHEELRTYVRRARERQIMVLFIVLDTLHSTELSHADSAQHSILSMTQVNYRTGDGKPEMVMEKYMDTFPFEYYLVLQDVDALPEVLSSTLKQFFEHVSGE